MKKAMTWILALMLALTFAASAADSADAAKSITTGLPTDHAPKIMICQMDNEPGARPQKGIGSADVVYEVEIYDGGYTRYTAIFNDAIPEKIEAIRSARIVHAHICYEYRGAFVHFGGQPYEGSNFWDYAATMHFDARWDGINEDDGSSNSSRDFYRDRNRV